ncbi:hypothetical protein C8T65DRAFT_739933 [Cerioporus squamosus]|nr:hypothetical protein C8T65DRAFT_739933 [Cerioporus squamosus]
MPSAVRQSVAELLVPEADALGQLTREELWWRDRYEFLVEKGYKLRDRYRWNWRPSWKEHSNRHPSEFEDWHRYENTAVVDAVRMKDHRQVVLKQFARGSSELSIVVWLNSHVLRRHSENHTVPVLETVYDVTDKVIAVMPLLRPCDDPAWDTVGEVVSFLTQLFEARLSHIRGIDIKAANIMYEPRGMYPKGYHPHVRDKDRACEGKAKRRTRTDHPVKYYFVSFSSAKRYWEATRPRESPRVDRKMTIGELQQLDDRPADPFTIDIKCLGEMVRTTILMKYRGVSFLAPLVKDMLQDNASKRPTAADVVRRFDALQGALTERRLRARLVPAYEGRLLGLCRDVRHTFRLMRWKRRDMLAVPFPREL